MKDVVYVTYCFNIKFTKKKVLTVQTGEVDNYSIGTIFDELPPASIPLDRLEQVKVI